MSAYPALTPARLFTTFGTVLYCDPASGELRHGSLETSPPNVMLVADAGASMPRRAAFVALGTDSAKQPVAIAADGRLVASTTGAGLAAHDTLELVPLERGLFGLRWRGLFLAAEPDGQVNCVRKHCSTWECFLGSEDWCSAVDPTAEAPTDSAVDRLGIGRFTIDPRLRARVNTNSTATRVLLYGYTKWSHGRVYYDLCKQLHKRGYIVDILNWRDSHAAYFADLRRFYALFVTAPEGVGTLVDSYGVPDDRIIVVGHSELDIRESLEQRGASVFDRVRNYGVVSDFLYAVSMTAGVKRPPTVVQLGVDYPEFRRDVSGRLATVGYASSMSHERQGTELKRGDLARQAARAAGLEFKIAGTFQHQRPFQDMPGFYAEVDAVLSTSISEGAGLQVVEAAAAGRLVISTSVGHFPLLAGRGGGIVAPIEARKFVAFAAETLRHYRNHPMEYVEKCRSIQQAARQFDWKWCIGDWIGLLEGADRSAEHH